MRLEGCAVRRVVRICTYADMCLKGIQYRADGILDFQRLGILPEVVVFTSYAARHRTFPLWVC